MAFFGAIVRDSVGRTTGNWPDFKPPWGRLMAVNANTGDFAWQAPLGVTDSLPEGRRNTGAQNSAGPMATAGGLVFIGSTNDNRFRAFDSKSGKELWTYKLDYTATAVPITFQERTEDSMSPSLRPPGEMAAERQQRKVCSYSLCRDGCYGRATPAW